MHIAIYILAITTFAMATTEFGIVGIIPRIASEFGLTLTQSGLIVTAYAIAMVCGAVGINMIGQRLAIRRIILGSILLFALANLFSALAPSYALLILGRMLSGLAQGAVYGLGTATAATIVARSHAARAVSIVFIGPTIAMVLGVPLAAVFGDGDNWRGIFVAIGIVALLSFFSLRVVMPESKDLRIAPASQLVNLLCNPKLLAIYAVTILAFGGSTMAFTYFPTLIGGSAGEIGLYMTTFGAGTVVGNLLAARVSDRAGFVTAAMIAIFGLIGCLAILPTALGWPRLLPAVLFFWGLCAFSLPPILQTEAVMVARSSGLSAAASSLNTASFNVGIGAAAFLASALVKQGGLALVPTAGAAMAGLALLLTLFLHKDQIADN